MKFFQLVFLLIFNPFVLLCLPLNCTGSPPSLKSDFSSSLQLFLLCFAPDLIKLQPAPCHCTSRCFRLHSAAFSPPLSPRSALERNKSRTRDENPHFIVIAAVPKIKIIFICRRTSNDDNNPRADVFYVSIIAGALALAISGALHLKSDAEYPLWRLDALFSLRHEHSIKKMCWMALWKRETHVARGSLIVRHKK